MLGPMLARLRGNDEAARRAALVELEAGSAAIDEGVCQALIELLADTNKETRRRAAGALALAATRVNLRERVEEALTAADPHIRWGAAFALARAGAADAEVVRAAIDALGSTDGDVRWAAAEIVCKAAPHDSRIAAELDTAVASSVAERRKMALYCLRDLGSRDPSVFAGALRDADRGVRLAALAGLARCVSLDADVAVRVAAAVREERDDGVKRAAAATLARFREQHADVAAALAGLAATTAGDGQAASAESADAAVVPKRSESS